MKKVVLLFLALVMLAGFVIKDSEAGQLCWNMSPYVDVVKVSTSLPDPLYRNHKLLNGKWDDTYTVFPVVGEMEKDEDGVHKIIGLHATKFSGGILQSWVWTATIDPITKEGPWNILNPQSGSTNSGTLVRIDCVTGAPLGAVLAESNMGRATVDK